MATARRSKLLHRDSKATPEEWRQALGQGQPSRARVYREYLHTKWWRTKRSTILDMALGRCEVCTLAKATQVHHVTYVRLGEELDEDLVAICGKCHRRVHKSNSLYPTEYVVILKMRAVLANPDKSTLIGNVLKTHLKYLLAHPRNKKQHRLTVQAVRTELIKRGLLPDEITQPVSKSRTRKRKITNKV